MPNVNVGRDWSEEDGEFNGLVVIGDLFTFETAKDGQLIALACGSAKRNDTLVRIHPDALMRILEKANPLAKGDEK